MTVSLSVLINATSLKRAFTLSAIVLISVLPASLTGCGKPADMVPVSGTVTVKGKPLEAGRIMFNPVTGGEGESAIGDVVNGKFTLFTVTEGDGVLIGKYFPTVLDPKNDTRKKSQRIGIVQLAATVLEVTEPGPNDFSIDITARDLKYAVLDD